MCRDKRVHLTRMLSAALSLSAIVVLASPVHAVEPSHTAEPLSGTFQGRAQGDRASSAPITLTLTDRGNNINGRIVLGAGLYLDAGKCGAGELPALTQTAVGRSDPARPRSFAFTTKRNVVDLPVSVRVDGRLSADSRSLTIRAIIDLPAVCGRDPVITGTLARVT